MPQKSLHCVPPPPFLQRICGSEQFRRLAGICNVHYIAVITYEKMQGYSKTCKSNEVMLGFISRWEGW